MAHCAGTKGQSTEHATETRAAADRAKGRGKRKGEWRVCEQGVGIKGQGRKEGRERDRVGEWRVNA